MPNIELVTAFNALNAGVPRLIKNNRIATFGDSRIELGWDKTVGSEGKYGRGIQFWCEVLTDARAEFRLSDDFGVGGNKTADMIARMGAVVANTASTIIVWGGTNDLAATSPQIPPTTTIANMTTIATALVAAGKTVIWIVETPRTGYSGSAARLLQVVDWQKTNLPALGVFVVDATEAIIDRTTSYNPRPAAFPDNLHPSADGAYCVAKVIAALLRQLLPSYDPLCYGAADSYDATDNPRGNLLVNGVLQGIGGSYQGATPTPTGDVANSMYLGGTDGAGMTLVGSKSVVGSREYQRIAFTGTPGGTNPQAQFYNLGTNAAGKVTAGQVVEGFARIDCAVSSKLVAVQLQVRAGVAGSFTYARSGIGGFNSGSVESYFPTEAWNGVIRTPKITIPSGCDSLILMASLYGYNARVLTADVGFANMTLRKVL